MNVKFIEIKYSVSNGFVIFITTIGGSEFWK